jgi:hypothetical protein
MSTLEGIIEDDRGNVIGASTDSGDVMLDPSDVVPRAGLASVAVTLAVKYGVSIPDSLKPSLPQGLTPK